MELGKQFTAEELNVPGYSIKEVRTKLATSEAFKQKADFDIDQQYLADTLSNKGNVYAYTDKTKRIVAVYACPRNGDVYSCDKRYVSSSLDEETIAKFDEQVYFLVAQRVSYDTKNKGIFLGEDMYALKQKSGGFNWSMAIVFALLYSVVFYSALHGPAGIGIGFCLGLCMGLCLTSHKYYYSDGTEQKEDTKEDSKTDKE